MASLHRLVKDSKKLANGSLSWMLKGMLDNSKENEGNVIPLTGNDSIQFMVFVMHAYARDPCDKANQPNVPNLRIMPATKTADCGVSSN